MDLKKWIHSTINVETEFLLFPGINIKTMKEGK